MKRRARLTRKERVESRTGLTTRGDDFYFTVSVHLCPYCSNGMSDRALEPGELWTCCNTVQRAAPAHPPATITCVDRERCVIATDGGER